MQCCDVFSHTCGMFLSAVADLPRCYELRHVACSFHPRIMSWCGTLMVTSLEWNKTFPDENPATCHTHTHHTDISSFLWVYMDISLHTQLAFGSEPFFFFHTGWWLFWDFFLKKSTKTDKGVMKSHAVNSEENPILLCFETSLGEKAEQHSHFINENKNGTKTSACGCEAKRKQHSPVHCLFLSLSLNILCYAHSAHLEWTQSGTLC